MSRDFPKVSSQYHRMHNTFSLWNSIKILSKWLYHKQYTRCCVDYTLFGLTLIFCNFQISKVSHFSSFFRIFLPFLNIHSFKSDRILQIFFPFQLNSIRQESQRTYNFSALCFVFQEVQSIFLLTAVKEPYNAG